MPNCFKWKPEMFECQQLPPDSRPAFVSFGGPLQIPGVFGHILLQEDYRELSGHPCGHLHHVAKPEIIWNVAAGAKVFQRTQK